MVSVMLSTKTCPLFNVRPHTWHLFVKQSWKRKTNSNASLSEIMIKFRACERVYMTDSGRHEHFLQMEVAQLRKSAYHREDCRDGQYGGREEVVAVPTKSILPRSGVRALQTQKEAIEFAVTVSTACQQNVQQVTLQED